jgi:hypothetical protein
VLIVYLSRRPRNMLVAESFLKSLIKTYGKNTVYSDGCGTWYPEACSSLGLKHRLHIHLLRKASLKELYSISRIGVNVLMITIIHAGTSYVTSHMYTNGQDYSCLCILLPLDISNLVLWLSY